MPDVHRVPSSRSDASGEPAGVVRFHGFVPRHVALQAVAEADAGLVLLGPGPGMRVFVSGKLYNYIGQSKQVLAMVPQGDARSLMATLGWGVITDPDPASVADAIELLLGTPCPAGPADPKGVYDRAVLAGLLADTLSSAARRAEARGDGTIRSRSCQVHAPRTAAERE